MAEKKVISTKKELDIDSLAANKSHIRFNGYRGNRSIRQVHPQYTASAQITHVSSPCLLLGHDGMYDTPLHILSQPDAFSCFYSIINTIP